MISYSASCLFECGYTQGKWAAAVGITVGKSPGEGVFDALVVAWASAGIPEGACLHFMFDEDQEEAYHAAYMRSAATKAGIRTKTIVGLSGLNFGDDDQVVDIDGEVSELVWKTTTLTRTLNEVIKFVWKTWQWETVYDVMNAGY